VSAVEFTARIRYFDGAGGFYGEQSDHLIATEFAESLTLRKGAANLNEKSGATAQIFLMACLLIP
jgi:hypothetical protein